MPFCWFCHEAAHIAMMDSFRHQFYPRMRQAGRDRKTSDSHRKGYSCPMYANGLSQICVRCLTIITETTTKKKKKKKKKKKMTERGERENVGFETGTFKRTSDHTISLD